MIIVLLNAAVFLTILAAVLGASVSNFSAARRSLAAENALNVAEAGADNFMFNINQNSNYTGTDSTCPLGGVGSASVTLFNDSVKGKGTYETCVTSGSISNEKIVYSIGKLYLPQTAGTPIETRTVKLVIEGSYSGQYSAQTGAGGLIMSNSSEISNGAVRVDGGITMSNNSQIGTSSNPAYVWAADEICPVPADATYPQICNGDDHPPITISGQAHIYGTVAANNQPNTNGMSNPGLTATTGVTAGTLPTYDRASQKAAATTTMTAAQASCSGSQSVTWPANVHITGGDVTLQNNCTVTVLGNAWLDGGLALSQKAVIKTGSSVASLAYIMIDGADGMTLNNQSSVATNASGVGFEFITFWSNASCSPDCTSSQMTGTSLYNSQTKQTILINNQGAAAGSAFYAYWTELTMGNSGSIGSILGQTLNLTNNGVISFSIGSGSQSLTWDVRYYQRQ